MNANLSGPTGGFDQGTGKQCYTKPRASTGKYCFERAEFEHSHPHRSAARQQRLQSQPIGAPRAQYNDPEVTLADEGIEARNACAVRATSSSRNIVSAIRSG